MKEPKSHHVNIDEYISTFPTETQEVLEKIRKTIRDAAPEATESISYDMAAFNLNDKYLIYFGGWKNHISVYGISAPESYKLLEDYKTQQGTYKFPLNKPFPYDLLKKVVELEVEHKE